jgi:purine-nucleoside phosphorylase
MLVGSFGVRTVESHLAKNGRDMGHPAFVGLGRIEGKILTKGIFEKAEEAAAHVRERMGVTPRVAVVLGSGLGSFAERVQQGGSINYTDIPHFPRPTVEGHSGRLVVGTVGETPVLVMQGRVHAYEGYGPDEVTFPIRVLQRLGITALVVTNASGGIRLDLKQGQLVLLSDHINFTGRNPVSGPNEKRFGPRFFDMSEAYSRRLRLLAHSAAELVEGVYLAVSGPSYETPAEIKAFRTLGADLVGMSTVHEVIVARHMGIEVLGISCVTNMAAGILDRAISHQEVIETGARIQTQLTTLLATLLPALHRGI